MADLGWLEPDSEGKWRWPFKTMAHGDWFRVAPELRSVGSVRNIAAVTAQRIGRKFSVITDEDGAILVRRVGERGVFQRIELMGYEVFRRRMKTLYRLDVDSVPWFSIEGLKWLPLGLYGVPKNEFVIVEADKRKFIVGLKYDGISIERVADDFDVQHWLQLKEAEAMMNG